MVLSVVEASNFSLMDSYIISMFSSSELYKDFGSISFSGFEGPPSKVIKLSSGSILGRSSRSPISLSKYLLFSTSTEIASYIALTLLFL